MSTIEHHIRAQLTRETTYAYRQLRAHLHDSWAGHCFVCDVPGPCRMYNHWLERLQALETAEERLYGNEREERA